MELNWTEFAIADLDKIEVYISAQGSPAAAIDQVLRVIEVAEKVLLEHSSAGCSGRVKGTRELVITGTPFVIIYRLKMQLSQIQVLRVLHYARQWPETH